MSIIWAMNLIGPEMMDIFRPAARSLDPSRNLLAIRPLIMSLRSSAKTGMPSKEVLERATRHAREIDAREKHGD